jgi:glycosyltransferase involved in cell wall biosynthesis
MTKIRILYIIDSLLNNAGTENHLLQLIKNLDKSRFKCYVFALKNKQIFMQKFIAAGAEIFPFSLKRIYDYHAVRIGIKLIIFLKKEKIDIVQTFHIGSDIYGTLVSKIAGVSAIISSRRDLGFCENKSYYTFLRRLLNLMVSKTICVSHSVRNTIINREKIKIKKIVTIYNGVDLNIFKNSVNKELKAKEIGLNPNVPIIGTIANIRPIKGLEYLIHAAQRVLSEFPDAQFIVAGGCVPGSEKYYNYLKSLIIDNNLKHNFFFLGERKDAKEIISILDIFVLPSLSEGFSNTVIEAMAMGKPVVATNVGGNPEAVLPNINGILVHSRDAEAISKAVIKLITTKNLVKRMGNNGRKRVEEFFKLDSMIKEMEKLYSALIYRKDNVTAIVNSDIFLKAHFSHKISDE